MQASCSLELKKLFAFKEFFLVVVWFKDTTVVNDENIVSLGL